MNIERQRTRSCINQSLRTNFWELVYEAKMSDMDKEVAELRFVRGLSLQETADKVGMSRRTVDRAVARVYDKIAKLI